METFTMSVKECIAIKGKEQNKYCNAIYTITDGDRIIYIGKTWRSVPQRLREHLKQDYSWIRYDVKIEVHVPTLEEPICEKESRLIKLFQPKQNKKLK